MTSLRTSWNPQKEVLRGYENDGNFFFPRQHGEGASLGNNTNVTHRETGNGHMTHPYVIKVFLFESLEFDNRLR